MSDEENFLNKKAKKIKNLVEKNEKDSILEELKKIENISRKTVILAKKEHKENKKKDKKSDDGNKKIIIRM